MLDGAFFFFFLKKRGRELSDPGFSLEWFDRMPTMCLLHLFGCERLY
jgi:hypothetical protein